MIKKTYIFLFIFLLPLIIFSQETSKIDSLNKVLSTNIDDTTRVNTLNLISWNYINSDFAKSLDYANQALELAQKVNFSKGIGLAYTYITYAQYLNGELDEALISINKAIAVFQVIDDNRDLARCLLTVGQIYYAKADYEQAIEYCNQSIEKKLVTVDSNDLETNYLTLGAIYQHKGNYSLALENFFLSIEYCELNNNTSSLASNYNNIAIIYKGQKKYDLALEYYNKTLELRRNTNNQLGEARTLNNIAVLFDNTNRKDTALIYYQQALDIFTEINYPKGIAMSYTNIAGINISLQNFSKVEHQLAEAEQIFIQINDKDKLIIVYGLWGQYYLARNINNKAIEYSLKAYNISLEISSLEQQSNLAEQLSNLYEKQLDYKNSLKYFHIFYTTHDSIFNMQNTELIEKMANEYENLQRQKEIEIQNDKIALLEKDKKIDNYKIYSLLSILLIAIISAIFIFISFKKKIKIQKDLRDKEKTMRELILKNKKEREKHLQEEIEYKSKELQNFAYHIVDKNDFILKIQNELKNAKKNFESSDTQKEIQTILAQINNKMLLERDREEFLAYVDQINDNFYYKLKQNCPDLTETETRIASLLRMEFSSKDISAILHITPKSVDTNRYRIRKKLEISSEIKLTKFFKDI